MCIEEGMDQEQYTQLHKDLARVDSVKNPLLELNKLVSVTAVTRRNRPVEEVKREKARQEKKPYRVPEWWVGEEQAGRNALASMGSVPKNIGQKVTE